jgi:hypothetical protein
MLILVRLLLEMLRTSLFSVWVCSHRHIHSRSEKGERGSRETRRAPDGLRLVEGGESGSRHTPDPTQ